MKCENDLLDLYCSKVENEVRPVLHYPFRQDGYICAGDGWVLIRIAETLCDGEYSENPNNLKAPKVSGILRQPNICLPITRQMLEDAISKAPDEKDRTCHECDGEGQVRYEYMDRNNVRYDKWCECPCCDGTGLIGEYTAQTTTFVLHGCHLPLGKIMILLKTMYILGVNALRARYIGQPTEILMFDVEDADINIYITPVIADGRLDSIDIV